MISIVIPIRNRAWSLEKTVASCLRYPADTVTEIIIADNGSTDEAEDLVEGLRARDPRVSWLAGPPEEPANANRARNRGLQRASGKYIQFLDSDDLLVGDKLSAQLQLLEQARGEAVSVSAWEWLYRSGKTRQIKPPFFWKNYENGIDLLADLWLSGGWFYTGCWLIPTRLARSVGGWNETLCADQDGEFLSRVLAAATGGVLFSPQTGIQIHLHGHQQLSNSRLDEAWKSRLQAWETGSKLLRQQWQDKRINKALKRRLRHIAYVYAGSSRPDLLEVCEQRDREIEGQDWTCPRPLGLAPLVSLLGLKRGVALRQSITRRLRGRKVKKTP